jgi:hypothetical protein
MAIAAGIDRVFEVGPVFRAEPSFTSRHATEFTGVDLELAWIDDVEDVMDFVIRALGCLSCGFRPSAATPMAVAMGRSCHASARVRVREPLALVSSRPHTPGKRQRRRPALIGGQGSAVVPEEPMVCGYCVRRDWTLCASAGPVRCVAGAQADGGDRVLP